MVQVGADGDDMRGAIAQGGFPEGGTERQEEENKGSEGKVDKVKHLSDYPRLTL